MTDEQTLLDNGWTKTDKGWSNTFQYNTHMSTALQINRLMWLCNEKIEEQAREYKQELDDRFNHLGSR